MATSAVCAQDKKVHLRVVESWKEARDQRFLFHPHALTNHAANKADHVVSIMLLI